MLELLLSDGQGEEKDDGRAHTHAGAHEVEAGAQESRLAVDIPRNDGSLT